MAPTPDRPEEERAGERVIESYRTRGLAGRVGFGERPAVLVVDFIVGFCDPDSPLGCDLSAELGATRTLLDAARSAKVRVLFTTTCYEEDLVDAGLFVRKVPSLATLTRGGDAVRLDPRLERRPEEPLIEKRYASAFFGTHLASTLTAAKIDTLIVAGCTTSGCVRATVVDALQHGYRAIVPRQCVGDRATSQHVASLVDIDGKYGDVEELDAVLAELWRVAGDR